MTTVHIEEIPPLIQKFDQTYMQNVICFIIFAPLIGLAIWIGQLTDLFTINKQGYQYPDLQVLFYALVSWSIIVFVGLPLILHPKLYKNKI